MISSVDVSDLTEEQVRLVQELVRLFRTNAQRNQEPPQTQDTEIKWSSRPFGGKGNLTRSEEDMITEMLDHDLVVRMPPDRRYTVDLEVNGIRKGMPRIVEPEGI
jgi:hypothetical protein